MKTSKKLLLLIVPIILLAAAAVWIFAGASLSSFPSFVGLSNYFQMLSKDSFSGKTFFITYGLIFACSLKIVIALAVLRRYIDPLKKRKVFYPVGFALASAAALPLMIIHTRNALFSSASYAVHTIISHIADYKPVIWISFLDIIVSLIIGFLTMLLFLLAETLFNFLKKKRRDNNKSQKAVDETKKAERIAYTVLAMLCNEAALLWLYIVAMSFIYNNSIMRMGVFSIETVWDFHSLSFPAGWAFLVFPLICLAAVILITVSIFKKRIGRRLAIWTAVLTASAFLVFLLIPTPSYALSWYMFIRRFDLFEYAKVIFGALTAAVAVFNVLFAVRKQQPKNPAA